MHKIAPNLYTFSGLVMGRVYAILDPDGVTLIDTGLELAAARIMAQLRAVGRQPHDVKRILITHAHPDHIGGLPQLERTTGAEIIVPALERAVVEGQIPIPTPPDSELSPLARRMRPPPTTAKPTPVDRVIEEGDTLSEVFGGLEVIAAPGHAPGHVAFWQPQRRILFCGDVAMNIPWGLRLPIAAFTVDMAENKRSLARLITLNPALVCLGHGQPLAQEATARLTALAQRVGAL